MITCVLDGTCPGPGMLPHVVGCARLWNTGCAMCENRINLCHSSTRPSSYDILHRSRIAAANTAVASQRSASQRALASLQQPCLARSLLFATILDAGLRSV